MANEEFLTQIFTTLSTNLQIENPDLTFDIINNQLLSRYKGGIFIINLIQNQSLFGLDIQFSILYKQSINENEMLKQLNNINCRSPKMAMLTKISETSGYISFGSSFLPLFEKLPDLSYFVPIFNSLRVFIDEIENDDSLNKIKSIITSGDKNE